MAGRKIPIQAFHWIARVKDVYYMIDDTYVFELQMNSVNQVVTKEIRIILDRTPPVGVFPEQKLWQLRYEIGAYTNRFETQLVSSKVVTDMNQFGIALGNFTDRIISS
jgi:hypothetical protein